MRIAFNPSTVAALTAPPDNKDITFDLRGRNIFARGVKFCGTDTNTWRDIKINNVSIDSNILDLRDGDNTTLTNINGIVTINSTLRPVVDNLTSDSTTSSLSANLGRILKALIDGKSDSDHNHDDRYLKLTGGTMASNALITFADSGSLGTNKGPQGARGGLYWTGQSDYAKLYAEETAGDNLDLVIQFGDDNSNGLSIRNASNVQTSYISAGGVITTGTFKGNLDWSYITNKPATATRWPSWDEIANKPNTFTPSDHNHDGRYVRYYAVTTLDCNNLAVGLTVARVAATNAARINHSAFLYISDVGTPFQIQIPDSNVSYIYKRYYLSGTWSGWFKLNAGYADSAGSAIRLTSLGNYTYDNLSTDIPTNAISYKIVTSGGTDLGDSQYNVLHIPWSSGDWGTYLLFGANNGRFGVKHKHSGIVREVLDSSNYTSILNNTYLPLAGGTMNGNARIGHGSGNLYIGNSNNVGWIYTQDIASLLGTASWNIRTSGAARFGRIHIASKNDESVNNNVIESDTDVGLHLNYFNNGIITLCNGGGNVGIGYRSPSYTLDVNGLMRADGFHHWFVDSNDYVLLAGGSYLIHKTGSTAWSTAILFGNYVWITLLMDDATNGRQVVPNNIAKPTINIYVVNIQTGRYSNSRNGRYRIAPDGNLYYVDGSDGLRLYTTICYVAS